LRVLAHGLRHEPERQAALPARVAVRAGLLLLGVALGPAPAEASRAPAEGVVHEIGLAGLAVDAVPVVAGRPGHAVDDKKMRYRQLYARDISHIIYSTMCTVRVGKVVQ
jgi:hypothetical protein